MEGTTLVTKSAWYKTTKGKWGIVIGLAAIVTTAVVLIIKNTNKVINAPSGSKKKEQPPAAQAENVVVDLPNNIYNAENLPGNGAKCGTVITGFGTTSDYVKCDGTWYTTVKKGIAWKSLADNKTAVELLNNKYPS